MSVSAFAGSGLPTKTQLFQKLSDVNIDQVIEIPYNSSLLANLYSQVQVHNIAEMQDSPNRLPESRSILEEYNDSYEYHADREVVSELTYKRGQSRCSYYEAVKVSDTLVCYKPARSNSSALAGNLPGPACTTVLQRLSHCFIFAHNVDDVIQAITGN
ncbi:MAG: hypothetical protein HRT44_12505 [Bdellovibrionales bacterium]|nr:hypothetical protein [Bdellovibrionales bacterium]